MRGKGEGEEREMEEPERGTESGQPKRGTMTGKRRDLADRMGKKKMDALCIQEMICKGSKAGEIGCKLFYHELDGKSKSVRIVLNNKLEEKLY